jgi:hypothetical protein
LIRSQLLAAIGFVEAHGPAFILGVPFARAMPSRSRHGTAAAVHALLGTANLLFWGATLRRGMSGS